MPNKRDEWIRRVKDVEREHGAARFAIEQLRAQANVNPTVFRGHNETRKALENAHDNLEGTYLVRLFAEFEAALRSFDRSRHNDPDRGIVAKALIDAAASNRRVDYQVKDGAHAVRALRNSVAHADEDDESAAPLALAQARSKLCHFLSLLPFEWD